MSHIGWPAYAYCGNVRMLLLITRGTFTPGLVVYISFNESGRMVTTVDPMPNIFLTAEFSWAELRRSTLSFKRVKFSKLIFIEGELPHATCINDDPLSLIVTFNVGL